MAKKFATNTCYDTRWDAQHEADRMNASRDPGDPFYEVFRVGEYFIVDYRREPEVTDEMLEAFSGPLKARRAP